MHPVLQKLAILSTDREASADTDEYIEPADMASMLDGLEELIREMDPDSEQKAEELQRKLGSSGDRILAAQLLREVSAFEFDDALQTLGRLQQSIERDR